MSNHSEGSAAGHLDLESHVGGGAGSESLALPHAVGLGALGQGQGHGAEEQISQAKRCAARATDIFVDLTLNTEQARDIGRGLKPEVRSDAD
jgi:hypothetical protein